MLAENRRSVVRWQINKQAELKVGDRDNFVSCQVKDINLKGIKITTDEVLRKDKFFKLTLALSSDFTLDVEVWVVWHRVIEETNIYGLYFNKIRDSDRENIYQFMHRNFAQEIYRQWWQDTDMNKEEGGEMMPSNKQFEDKRVFARFPMEFPLRFLNSRANREGEGRTRDISAKGIGMVTSEQIIPNTSLELWLKIPDQGEPLYTRGEVVWSRRLDQNVYDTGINLDRADLMGMSRAFRAA